MHSAIRPTSSNLALARLILAEPKTRPPGAPAMAWRRYGFYLAMRGAFAIGARFRADGLHIAQSMNSDNLELSLSWALTGYRGLPDGSYCLGAHGSNSSMYAATAVAWLQSRGMSDVTEEALMGALEGWDAAQVSAGRRRASPECRGRCSGWKAVPAQEQRDGMVLAVFGERVAAAISFVRAEEQRDRLNEGATQTKQRRMA